MVKEKEKKKICKTCEGIGLVKNKNMYCVKCNASRCEYTQNICKEEFYKYKFCEFCNGIAKSESSPKSHKTHCLKCLGEGYYQNSSVVCNYCMIPHLVCDCNIKPFDECSECYGSGTQE
jgi:hypothetical protein